MNRIYVDMDGVVVDFEAAMRKRGILTGDEAKRVVGFYRDAPFVDGAKEAIASLLGMGFSVWLATKPPTGIAHAYADKAQWVFDNLPELKRNLILTHDKGTLGDAWDILIDDRPHKANCNEFAGRLLTFYPRPGWERVLKQCRRIADICLLMPMPAHEYSCQRDGARRAEVNISLLLIVNFR